MTAAADPPLRLLVLASKPVGRSPSQRFRTEQWAPRLSRDHGITLDFAPFESDELSAILYERGHTLRKAALVLRDFARRSSVLARLGDYDAVVIHREAALLGPAIYERLIARSGKPIIFDFDDAIWSPLQGRSNGIFSRLHFHGKTRSLCRLATLVTPGNAYLADYARRFNDRVEVVPTSIELDDYPMIEEPAADGPFVVCWTGSISTLAHFEHARAPLEALARQVDIVVKVVCNRPPERPIACARTDFIPWSADTEARAVGDSHVGIMPLPDDEFTRGKCGLKALQCMATGRPVVISPVGVNVDIVRHGENGFLATTTDDYVRFLLQLARSPDLRARLGAEARRTVEETYSAKVVALRFAKLVRSALR